MVNRAAQLLERDNSPNAATARAFVIQGVDYARRVLAVAHGDHSKWAKMMMPPIGEGISWIRTADRLAGGLKMADPDWWRWYQKRGQPPADLRAGGLWNGEVRGKGAPEPPLPGTVVSEPKKKGPAAEAKPPAVKIGAEYPRIKSLLTAHKVSWMDDREQMEEQVKLPFQDPSTMVALGLVMGKLTELAAKDPKSAQWLTDKAHAMGCLAAMSHGYGIGRLALGTARAQFTHSGSEEEANKTAAKIVELATKLDFDAVTKLSPSPAALIAAVDGVAAERAREELRDPITRLGIEAGRRGFLVAIAEEAVVNG
jgi:hypothetical protein